MEKLIPFIILILGSLFFWIRRKNNIIYNQVMSGKPHSNRLLDFQPEYKNIIDKGHKAYLISFKHNLDIEIDDEHLCDGRLVLDISPIALALFKWKEDHILVYAKFSGNEQYLKLPYIDIYALVAQETGEGIIFQD